MPLIKSKYVKVNRYQLCHLEEHIKFENNNKVKMLNEQDGDLKFKFRVGQILLKVTNDSPLLNIYASSCVALVLCRDLRIGVSSLYNEKFSLVLLLNSGVVK